MLNTLDLKNLFSVRRFLADMVHLPAASGKLMFGTDFEFVSTPLELVSGMLNSGRNTMLYTYSGEMFRVTADLGPQCSGLLGDMYYTSPGDPFSLPQALSFLSFYAQLPISPNRTTPPCDFCVIHSSGMHAWDQFASQMYFGSWTNGSCRMLSAKYHTDFFTAPSERMGCEGIHTKTVFPCVIAI